MVEQLDSESRSDVNVSNKEYEALMDAARSHMNAAQAYFEAARQMVLVGREEGVKK